MRRASPGFTLLEVLVVMGILAVLMGLSAGFIQRAGRGNLLTQAIDEVGTRLATVSNASVGNAEAFVSLEPRENGSTTVRASRFRQVYCWPCEDFDRASEDGNLTKQGDVKIADGPVPSREGRHVVFGSGSGIDLGKASWLDMQDGVSLQCRLFAGSAGSGATLFRKGRAFQVKLVHVGGGRYDVEFEVSLQPDREGQGGGTTSVRTGTREAEELPEWKGPILANRWMDLRCSYDRNSLSIYVDDNLRAVRGRLDRRMALDPDQPLIVGGGYQGGFDSLVISGIFEDDEDRFDIPPGVRWIDAEGKPVEKPLRIHFLNRSLDPRRHERPIDLHFRLDEGNGEGPRRRLHVTLSGEVFPKGPGE